MLDRYVQSMATRKKKRDSDFAVNAFRVVQEANGQTQEPQERKSLSL